MSACPRVLIIAGSDSGGGAGIQADIKTVTMLGGHAMTAVTAITAQNTLSVTGVWTLPAEAVISQIDAVVSDLGVDAVKIGMIGSAAVAQAVADRLAMPDLTGVPVVFDPVMIATSGSVLADEGTVSAFVRLIARATLSTPNLDELAALAGLSAVSEDEITAAACSVIERASASALLVTGVKLAGATIVPQEVRARSTDGLLFDLLFDRKADAHVGAWWGERIDTIHDHGTGCTLASGIATGLGAGLPLPDAIGRARAYVRAALRAAPGYGAGHGPMGHGLAAAPFDALESSEAG